MKPWTGTLREPVEQDKPPEQRGKYLPPELFGQSPEKGIHYREQPVSPQASR